MQPAAPSSLSQLRALAATAKVDADKARAAKARAFDRLTEATAEHKEARANAEAALSGVDEGFFRLEANVKRNTASVRLETLENLAKEVLRKQLRDRPEHDQLTAAGRLTASLKKAGQVVSLAGKVSGSVAMGKVEYLALTDALLTLNPDLPGVPTLAKLCLFAHWYPALTTAEKADASASRRLAEAEKAEAEAVAAVDAAQKAEEAPAEAVKAPVKAKGKAKVAA